MKRAIGLSHIPTPAISATLSEDPSRGEERHTMSPERTITIAISDRFLDSPPDAEYIVAVLRQNILWKVRLVEETINEEDKDARS
jgi:hypothetical protein